MKQEMGVGALIFDKKNRVLLNYRNKNLDFYPGCWFIPCGKVEKDESPIEAIVREVEEETGLEVTVLEEVYSGVNERNIPEVAYRCKILKGSAENMEPRKFKDIQYFSLDNLPPNTGKRTLEVIEAYKRFI